MSPHAVLPSESNVSSGSSSPGYSKTNDHYAKKNVTNPSVLRRTDDDELHDLICIGFGPASLSIAIALQDAVENSEPLRTENPKVRFLEKQSQFAWHAGMLLPGAKMQITFIKDLATLRDPRSKFTFLNYLHQKQRLVQFTNLGTFLPQRTEYEDYMRWCADHFDDVVDYDQDVEAVEVGQKSPKTGKVEYFHVRSVDRSTNTVVTRRAKHVVIATGGKPSLPQCLDGNHPRVIHSSQYATSVHEIFPPGKQPRSVAIIGAGQSAAEIFHNVPQRFPEAKSILLIKGSSLRPSDDSPFVNEIFDPERVDDVYSQDFETKAKEISLDKGTNYGVVRLELLEEIYSTLYSYRIKHESEQDWPQQILNHRNVTGMSDISTHGEKAVRLHVTDHSGEFHAHKQSRDYTLDVDLVVVAAGYRRDAHEFMLKDIEHLQSNHEKGWEIGRDYGVKFEEGVVQPDAGIWLQGCNESTHGLSDTLLSILATRSGEMVQNVFGVDRGSNGV